MYAVVGAQAIAMLAYGVRGLEGDATGAVGSADVCEPVNIITGPGNVFVAAAKRLVNGVVGIDSEAGPSEIAVLADDTANATFVAYDLISQAEHDPMAASVLVTPSEALVEAVESALAAQVPAAFHHERIEEALPKALQLATTPGFRTASTSLTDAFLPEQFAAAVDAQDALAMIATRSVDRRSAWAAAGRSLSAATAARGGRALPRARLANSVMRAISPVPTLSRL